MRTGVSQNDYTRSRSPRAQPGLGAAMMVATMPVNAPVRLTVAALLLVPLALSQPQPLFVQHEKLSFALSAPANPGCSFDPTNIVYAELIVFDNREVVYRCSAVNRFAGGRVVQPRRSPWNPPGGWTNIFRSRLTTAEFAELKTFLNRDDVKVVRGFVSAGGPAVGDFDITIARPPGTQHVEVICLLPNATYIEPGLIELVCKGKDLARKVSGSGELPGWCKP